MGASHALIPAKLYKKIVSSLPIVCVDLLIWRNRKLLLVKRKNAPLKGKWWVVGGRVLLGEDPRDAVIRKAKEEVGLELEKINFVGYYSDVYQENVFERTPYQTISLVFICTPKNGDVKLDDQSGAFKWADGIPQRFTLRYF